MPSDEKLAYWLLKNVNRAIHEYAMIPPGARVAVALSGGKDSLSLLRLLDLRRKTTGESYSLLALHILGDGSGPIPAHRPLVEWMEANGYEVRFEPFGLADGEEVPLNCQRCTWNRRKALFAAAKREGCSLVAFAHHADDLAQTTLLNLLYHGKVETMLPRREYFGGEITLIRPLCYTRESELRRFARASGFPPPPPDCPRAKKSSRAFVRDLLRQIEREVPEARNHLLRAGLGGE